MQSVIECMNRVMINRYREALKKKRESEAKAESRKRKR